MTKFDKLSKREMDVFTAIARGDRPKQIADTFGLSVKTVSTYRARVIEKLGITGGNAGIAMLMHAERLRVADDHALVAAALCAGVARWESFTGDPASANWEPFSDPTKASGEVCIGHGIRYATSLDDAGVPILTNLLRDALLVAMPVQQKVAA